MKNRFLYVLLIFATILTLIFTVLAQSRHIALETGYDFGVIAGTIHHILQGNYYTIPDGVQGIENGPYHFFSVHFNFIVYLIEPFYYLFPFTLTLFFIQSVAINFASIALFFLFRKKFGDKISFFVAVAYLVNPLALYLQVNDLHFVALVPLALFLLFINWEKNWLIYSIILLSIKETIAIPLFLLSLIMYFHKKKNSLAILRLSAVWILVFFIISRLFGSETLDTVLVNVANIDLLSGLMFIVFFGLSVGFISLLSIFVLPLLPAFILSAISNFSNHYGGALFYHEYFVYLAFAFISLYHFKYLKKLYLLPIIGCFIVMFFLSVPQFDKNISPIEMGIVDSVVQNADMSQTFYMHKKFFPRYYYLSNVKYLNRLNMDNIPYMSGYIFVLGDYTGEMEIKNLGYPNVPIYKV